MSDIQATAVVVATAPSADGGPAAALPWDGEPLLARLLGQLESLGTGRAHVITRPEWAEQLRAAAGARAEVQTTPDPAGDLRAIAQIARATRGTLVLVHGEVATQREALAGLLADPRIATGVLTTAGLGKPFTVQLRQQRGRIVSAGSAYHAVHRPTTRFLSVIRVAAGDLVPLAEGAEAIADLVDGELPEGWEARVREREGRWRVWLHNRRLRLTQQETAEGQAELDEDDSEVDPWALELPPEEDREIERRIDVLPRDVVALALVGLVRSGAHVGSISLRKLFWSRPLTPEGVERARRDIGGYDEDQALLDSAVKASDGFFTTFFVSPYSRYIARWAARRELTPNQVTIASFAVAVVAAAGMATGERWGLIAGALLLQAAFTLDCVDGQLARYSRQFSKLGAWLDAILDRAKEYTVYAGLAIGASRAGDPVWVLAGAALTLQTVRHIFDFSWATSQHQAIATVHQPPVAQADDAARRAVLTTRAERQATGAAPAPKPLSSRVTSLWRRLDRGPGKWIKKMVAFPIGERFAAVSVTAALWDARTTFVVLLAWGGFALLYTSGGRALRSIR